MELNAAYLQIKEFITHQTGIIYYRDKDTDLMRKLEKRMEANNIKDIQDYQKLLSTDKKGDEEFDQLVNLLTIGETYFFRNKETFNGLKEIIIPQLLEQKKDSRTLRIWCAGCASGEEPYSISIILQREFPHILPNWDISILGTDINRDFLARAIEGRYGDWSFRETPPDIKEQCFTQDGRFWLIKPQYKSRITFQYHNLVKNPYPSMMNNLLAFDVIFCRNVIIYFNVETITQLVKKFAGCLLPKGWLVIGHADYNVHFFKGFQTVSTPGTFLLHKIESNLREPENKPLAIPSQSFLTNLFPDKGKQPATSSTITSNIPTPTLPSQEKFNTIPSFLPTAGSPEQNKGRLADTTLPANPPQSEPLLELAQLTDSGQWKQALDLVKKLNNQDRLNPVPYFYQGLIKEQTGHPEEAETALKQAIYLDRNFVLAHFHLGLLQQNKGNINGAAKSFENVTRLLRHFKDNHVFTVADSMTAAQLKELTAFHLEVLIKYGKKNNNSK